MVVCTALAAASALEPGRLEDTDADGRVAIEVGVGGVVECGEINRGHILDAHDGMLGLLHDDIGELVGVGEARRASARKPGKRRAAPRGG